MRRSYHVLTGPTAAGKTGFLLGRLPAGSAVVISADSRQVYRLMDIGTGKPEAAELTLLPHYGLDILDLGTKFSVYQFLIRLSEWLRDLRDDPRQVWICGGTGLYIHALLNRLELGAPPRAELRLRLSSLIADQSARFWAGQLGLSPADPDNPVRVIRSAEEACLDPLRATEIHERLGLDPQAADNTAWQAEQQAFAEAQHELERWHCAGLAVLDPGREALQQRIRLRVRRMFELGLPEEVARIRAAGYGAVDELVNGIAYREAGLLLDGVLDYEAAVEQAVIRTRQYAKRQRTYFRGRGWAEYDDAGLEAWFSGLRLSGG
ncbi:MAG: tRNA (adenosine(37)-N6)-dimethylallyltransferase MiaA [bacterium]